MLSSKLVLLATIGFIAVVSAHPGMGGGPMTGGPFAELTDAQKADIKAIFTKEGLIKQQIQDEIKAYFTNLGGDALTKFNELEGKMESMKTNMITKAEDATKNFSPASKALVEQLKNIKLNMGITPAEDQKQTKALLEAAPEDVKTEIKTLKDLFGHGHEGGHFFTTVAPASA